MKYTDELKRAMTWMGKQSDTIFLGQSTEYPGTAIFNTLSEVPKEKRREQPIAENMQMGISIGLALNGFVPISIFPRWNFLILAADQIVNHLDKLKAMSNGGYQPKVIIRVGVGSQYPLDPQEQHKSNFSSAFRNMLTNIDVIELHEPEDIFPAYQRAYERTDGKSTIISEFSDYLNLK